MSRFATSDIKVDWAMRHRKTEAIFYRTSAVEYLFVRSAQLKIDKENQRRIVATLALAIVHLALQSTASSMWHFILNFSSEELFWEIPRRTKALNPITMKESK